MLLVILLCLYLEDPGAYAVGKSHARLGRIMPVYRWLRASRLWPVLSSDPYVNPQILISMPFAHFGRRVQAVSLGNWEQPFRPPSPKHRNKIFWAPDDREPVQLYPRLDEKEWQ